MTKRYQELVGSLIYLEQCTRPDLSYPTNLLGQYMSRPTEYHWELAKKVLKYLKGTTHYSLVYCKDESLELIAHCDADFANSEQRYSHSGYITYLNNNSSPISWSSRKQKLVARSMTEVEYISLSDAACELLWLQSLFRSLFCNNIFYCPSKL